MASGPDTLTDSPLAAEREFHGRYRTGRVLKRGGNVATLLGEDSETQQPVIIKTINARDMTNGAAIRLEHEAQVMRQIHGPSLSTVLHVGRSDDVVYLIMPYIEGVSLDERLQQRPLGTEETLAVGIGLLEALRKAHDQGVLHRDIKPANVIVNESGPVDRATLIDFGLSHSAQLDPNLRDQPVGTARYMAPEQAGLLNYAIDQASDLYSCGIVLYECLAGQPPFCGESVGEVLRQHMTQPVEPLTGLNLHLPRALDEVIERLLRKDPRDRYQSTEAVLADLKAITAGLARGEQEPAVVIGLNDRRKTLTEPAFVGREEELKVLARQLSRLKSGAGRIVLVEAESGVGKSRMLAEFCQRAVHSDILVLRGQGQDHVGQRPFQMLDGIVQELVRLYEHDPAVVTGIRQRLGDHADAVRAALPELGPVLGEVAGERLPEEFGEARSLQALAALLESLGTSDRPAFVILDDCQWADELAVKLLALWRRRRKRSEPCFVTLLVAFRSDEVDEKHELRNLKAAATVRLEPFAESDVRQLIESMAGPLPDEAVALVEQFSEGSPFMAGAVLRGLVETGALVPEPNGWQVNSTAMNDVQSSRHAAAFLTRRLQLLSDETLEFLSVGALLGKEFDFELAAHLAQQELSDAYQAVQDAHRRNLVWLAAQGSSCSFVHDRIRATLLARLDETTRRRLHLAAATELKKIGAKEDTFRIAYHFGEAGEHARALPFALRAAEQARARYALEVAQQQYEIAEKALADADQETRCLVAEGLGDVLMLRGKYREAAVPFETAQLLVTDATAQARLDGKIGELAFKRGNMKTACESLERALQRLGRRVPSNAVMLRIFILWEAFVQCLHAVLPRLFTGRRKLDGADCELLAIRLYNKLAYAYWFDRGSFPCLWAHLHSLNLAERYPPTPELAHSYSIHAPVMTLIPLQMPVFTRNFWLRRGEIYVKKSFDIRRDLGDIWGQGQSLHFWAIIDNVASRFDDCIEKCQQAIRLLEKTGDFWERNVVRYHMANSTYRKGNLATAIVQARRLHEAARDIGDDQSSGMSLDIWSRASGGKLPSRVVDRERDLDRHDAQATGQVLLAEAIRLLGQDELAAAVDVLNEAQGIYQKKGIRSAWVAPLYLWEATALRLQYQQSTELTPHRRRTLLTAARRAVRRGTALAKRCQNDLPHAIRELGMLAAIDGRNTRAKRLLEKSLTLARYQGAMYEAALSHLRYVEVGEELNWGMTRSDIENARLDVDRLERGTTDDDDSSLDDLVPEPASLSLIDRFDTVLDDCPSIAAKMAPAAIFEEAHKAAIRLLRGERCTVFHATSAEDGTIELRFAAGYEETSFSVAFVQQAFSSQKPVSFMEGIAGDTSESIVLSGVRSALCAPIFLRGRPTACLYVTHREVVGLFRDDEERLAALIAAIAGAALENAEGYNQLQELNRTLEQRVADRTADLEEQSLALKKSNADLEQFAYVVSHDMQEPLRTISGYCQLLERRFADKLDDQGREFIQFAVDGAQRMRNLISDLLAYSRVDRKGKPFAKTDCNRLIEKVLFLNLRASIEENGAQVTHDDLPTIDCDATQYTLLFQNLIGNAIKFRGDRTPKIHVGVEGQQDGWMFSVRDNGIGMPEEQFDRIFQVFQRLHTRDEYEGTGIGLSVCKKTVERHGGRIWVESTPSEGSTFFFTIPATLGDD